MADFLTRVMLHDGTVQDYDALHAEMEARRFQRTIVGSDGVRYKLPWAEYSSRGDITPGDVRQHANDAVAVIGKTAEILVAQYSVLAWSGLDRA